MYGRMNILILFLSLFFLACESEPAGPDENPMNPPNSNEEVAVTKVEAAGSPGSYTFSVTLSSPDTGCDQYADWWEVFRADSSLVYRRILAHSHVNEQPFSRSGGPADIQEDEIVFIRGHMNNLGYGRQIFKGSVKDGFVMDSLEVGYAAGLASTAPLPDDCAF